jgi:hypothetical protein
MSVREKIIVALMLITVTYGLFTWLTPGRPPGDPAAGAAGSAQQIEALVANLAATFDQGSTLERDRHLIAQAEAAWGERLFLEALPTPGGPAGGAAGNGSATPTATVPLVYSGFISMGPRRIAVINGIEYEAGERLDHSALVLQTIEDDHVQIGGPRQEALRIPLSNPTADLQEPRE